MYYALSGYPMEKRENDIRALRSKAEAMLSPLLDAYPRERTDGMQPVEICVDFFLEAFPHLTMDPDYSLYAYNSYEYHGRYGRAAAVRHGEPHTAAISVYPLESIKLPEAAVDPMEVIYCDGTPEGYLDAVLFRKMLFWFSRRGNCDTVLFECPESIAEHPDSWDMLLKVENWVPAVKKDTLYLFMFEYEDGIAPSNGKSRITLQSYYFTDILDLMRTQLKSDYPKQLSGRGRYGKGKHCCVFSRETIVIAEEKECCWRKTI